MINFYSRTEEENIASRTSSSCILRMKANVKGVLVLALLIIGEKTMNGMKGQGWERQEREFRHNRMRFNADSS